MTSSIVPNPFAGEQGVRIERAVREAVAALQWATVGDVLIALRLDPNLSNDDFRTYVRALLEPRLAFAAERWVMAVANGEVR